MAFVSDDIWENIPGPGESLGLRLGLALHWLTPLYSSLVIGIGTYFLGEVTKTGMTGAAKDLDGAVTFVAFLLGLWSPVGHVRSVFLYVRKQPRFCGEEDSWPGR